MPSSRLTPRRFELCLAFAVLVTLAAVAPPAGAACRVTVSIEPLAWLVERLIGDDGQVCTALAPGESPATYDPTPRRLAELARTDLYLGVGVPMERVLLPHLRRDRPGLAIHDLAEGLEKLAIGGHSHDHGDGHDHAHEFDPHVWLSPRLMGRMAESAARILAARHPELGEALPTRAAALQSDLADLDAELRAILSPAAGRTLVVFHPAFGYLARDYGLVQRAIEKDGLPPSPRRLAEVLAEIRAQGLRAIFVQPQEASAQLQALARAEGLQVLELDPLAGDYTENMRRMAEVIAGALAPGAETP